MNGWLIVVAGGALAILLAAARTYGPQHISTPTEYPRHAPHPNVDPMNGVEPDGLCHCDPQPDSSPIGECPACHRLDPRKAYA